MDEIESVFKPKDKLPDSVFISLNRAKNIECIYTYTQKNSTGSHIETLEYGKTLLFALNSDIEDSLVVFDLLIKTARGAFDPNKAPLSTCEELINSTQALIEYLHGKYSIVITNWLNKLISILESSLNSQHDTSFETSKEHDLYQLTADIRSLFTSISTIKEEIDSQSLFSVNTDIDTQKKIVLWHFGNLWEHHIWNYTFVKTDNNDFSIFYEVNSDLSSLIFVYLYDLIYTSTVIKKCRYCGDYFIPFDNKSAIYCNKINGNGKTCKENGAAETYRASLSSQTEKMIYHKAYRKAIYLKNNSVINEHQFAKWKQDAHEMMKQVHDKQIALEDYETWMGNSIKALKKI